MDVMKQSRQVMDKSQRICMSRTYLFHPKSLMKCFELNCHLIFLILVLFSNFIISFQRYFSFQITMLLCI
ncbi:hypothetical protein XELAEV_18015678mg [Xenopus laevis]|uniref:Uncharacterized protein n=1 Tax=Xenopus laevis TaxID=8355 RepID=A0A974DKC4_XENLA|nr:hypothetical protein XELAEV_18015678mg [Xenopus laevis]